MVRYLSVLSEPRDFSFRISRFDLTLQDGFVGSRLDQVFQIFKD